MSVLWELKPESPQNLVLLKKAISEIDPKEYPEMKVEEMLDEMKGLTDFETFAEDATDIFKEKIENETQEIIRGAFAKNIVDAEGDVTKVETKLAAAVKEVERRRAKTVKSKATYETTKTNENKIKHNDERVRLREAEKKVGNAEAELEEAKTTLATARGELEVYKEEEARKAKEDAIREAWKAEVDKKKVDAAKKAAELQRPGDTAEQTNSGSSERDKPEEGNADETGDGTVRRNPGKGEASQPVEELVPDADAIIVSDTMAGLKKNGEEISELIEKVRENKIGSALGSLVERSTTIDRLMIEVNRKIEESDDLVKIISAMRDTYPNTYADAFKEAENTFNDGYAKKESVEDVLTKNNSKRPSATPDPSDWSV